MDALNTLTELDHDSMTSLRLAVDANDPPRFYVLDRRQRPDLIAIRDADLAYNLYLKRVAQKQQPGGREDQTARDLIIL